MRTLGWVVMGIFIGLVASKLVTSSFSPLSDIGQQDGPFIASEDDRAPIQYQAVIERLGKIEAELETLSAKFEETMAVRPVTVDQGVRERLVPPSAATEIQSLADRMRGLPTAAQAAPTPDPNQVVERLVAGGFTPDRAEWIKRHNDEQLMRLIEARYIADRSGAPLSAQQVADLEPEMNLRKEIGDSEYEKYLRALGRDLAVTVMTVIENSPAAQAGLQAGDRIVSYGGKRVFDFREVTPLTLEGRPNEPVIVDLVRAGRSMQIVVPRGPLGVSLFSERSSDVNVARP